MASDRIDGHLFITKAEYHQAGKPCACPDDRTRGGRRCGKMSALCKNGGANILDCGNKAVKTILEYKKIKKRLCGNDF